MFFSEEFGGLTLTLATYELLKDDFICEFNGPVDIKGKGSMETWFLVGSV